MSLIRENENKKSVARINSPLSERVNSGIHGGRIVALLFLGCEQYLPSPSPSLPPSVRLRNVMEIARNADSPLLETPYVAMCNVILHKLAEVSAKGNIP